MTWQTSSTGSAETESLGELLGKLLKPPVVLELCSDLGGGKTTFVRGLARGLGSNDTVTSPTFTINQIYHGRDGVIINHFDFYRLNEAGIVADLLDEAVNDPQVVTVVEWSDIVQNVLPKDHIKVELRLNANKEEERQINFSYSSRHANLIHQIETDWMRLKP